MGEKITIEGTIDLNKSSLLITQQDNLQEEWRKLGISSIPVEYHHNRRSLKFGVFYIFGEIYTSKIERLSRTQTLNSNKFPIEITPSCFLVTPIRKPNIKATDLATVADGYRLTFLKLENMIPTMSELEEKIEGVRVVKTLNGNENYIVVPTDQGPLEQVYHHISKLKEIGINFYISGESGPIIITPVNKKKEF